MHIDIPESSPLFEPFDSKRKELGFTTFKSAILRAMKLFLEQTTPSYSTNGRFVLKKQATTTEVDCRQCVYELSCSRKVIRKYKICSQFLTKK